MINLFMFGLAGSGKDTAAKIMERVFGIRSIALADEVRAELTKNTGITDYRSNRSKLIQVGETYKQLYGKDIWCKRAMEKIRRGKQTGEYAIADSFLIRDGRYEHEYEFFVKQRGYVPVRIVADRKIRIQRMQERGDDIDFNALAFEEKSFVPDHRFAFELKNNGTIEELAEQIQDLLEDLIAISLSSRCQRW